MQIFRHQGTPNPTYVWLSRMREWSVESNEIFLARDDTPLGTKMIFAWI